MAKQSLGLKKQRERFLTTQAPTKATFCLLLIVNTLMITHSYTKKYLNSVMIYGSVPNPISIYFWYMQISLANHFAISFIWTSMNYFCRQLWCLSTAFVCYTLHKPQFWKCNVCFVKLQNPIEWNFFCMQMLLRKIWQSIWLWLKQHVLYV